MKRFTLLKSTLIRNPLLNSDFIWSDYYIVLRHATKKDVERYLSTHFYHLKKLYDLPIDFWGDFTLPGTLVAGKNVKRVFSYCLFDENLSRIVSPKELGPFSRKPKQCRKKYHHYSDERYNTQKKLSAEALLYEDQSCLRDNYGLYIKKNRGSRKEKYDSIWSIGGSRRSSNWKEQSKRSYQHKEKK